jgi:hypothetical protein
MEYGQSVETIIGELNEAPVQPVSFAEMQRRDEVVAEGLRPKWTGEHSFDVEKAIASGPVGEVVPIDLRLVRRDPLHELVARAVREELKRHASNVEPDEEDEELAEVQLPEDRGAGDVNSRRVENMAASIRSKMEDGASKDAAVSTLMEMAGSQYSKGIVTAAAELVTV